MSAGPKLSASWLAEGFRRLWQLVPSGALFDFPGLLFIRMLMLRAIFDVKAKVLVGKGFYFIVPHGLPRGRLTIGEGTKLNHNVEIDYSGSVVIGRNVWVSQNVLIETHEHVLGRGDKEDWEVRTSPLEIADGVWIGANVIVLPTVRRIGANSIIGAGSVVTRDVPDGVVVAGAPAKVIRNLTVDEVSVGDPHATRIDAAVMS